MDDLSIDQKKLPGVKEVCRDFAVLEDHCLAHNLQEQEIESHLASNIHKNRLVQQDLRVAKRLQEEEDQRAKAHNRKHHKDIERTDSEMAQEIQEQLVWQAEQQRKQEEKDEAIARKLQEREMKEERKRQKQLEANLEEEYYEDRGALRPPSDSRVQYPGPDSPAISRAKHRDLSHGRSPDHRSPKLDPKRHRDGHGTNNRSADHYPPESGRSRDPEQYSSENRRGRHDEKGRRPEPHPSEGRNKYPEEYLPEKNHHSKAEYAEHRSRGKKYQTLEQLEEPIYDQEPEASNKDRPSRDDRERDKERERARRRDRDQDRERERDGRRDRDKVKYGDREQGEDRLLNLDTIRDGPWSLEMERDVDINGYRHRSRDREPERDRDRRGRKNGARERDRDRDRGKHRSRDRSRGRERDDPSLPSTSRGWSEEGLENAEYGIGQRPYLGANEVFEEPSSRGHSGEARSPGHSPRERGRVTRGEYGVKEATQGLSHMDLRGLESRDMEVARRLQEEELRASKLDKRAAQVAQDEEIARRLMEEEQREYKRAKDKEKQAMERQHRRAEGDFNLPQEEVVRPRTQEEYNYERPRNPKPARPPPRAHNYENVDPSYAYSESYAPRPTSRPEAAYKGAYYRQ